MIVKQVMIETTATLCDADKDADIETIVKVVEAERAWGEFTRTTVLFRSLSMIGQPGLIQDTLDTLYSRIDEHILY